MKETDKKENTVNLKLGVESYRKGYKPIVEGEDSAKSKPKDVYLTESARDATTMFIGTAGSGKSQYIIPLIFKQDLEKKDRGITVICSQKDIAYTLYAMAKEAKRKVILLKPSTNFAILNELLKKTTWNYNYINDNFINYKKAIKEKNVVIIDMEYDFYRNDAVRATAMLLLQFQTDMCITSETKKTKHYVYIDDCQHYLPFIEMLIECGNSYNVSSCLFFQGRNQFVYKDKDYTGFIDNNVRNTFLMNNMNYEDVKYYGEKLCPKNIDVKSNIYNYLRLPYGNFIYDIQGENYQRWIGIANLLGLTEAELQKIKKKAIKHRKTLTKIKDREYNAFLLQDEIECLYRYGNNKKVEASPAQEAPKTTSEPPQPPQSTEEPIKAPLPPKEVVAEPAVIEPSPIPEIPNDIEETDDVGLQVLNIQEGLLDDDEIDESISDDFDNVMEQLEGTGIDDIQDSEELPGISLAEEQSDEIEFNERIETTQQTRIVKGNRVNHILFPTIVNSMQKQYNGQLKNIK